VTKFLGLQGPKEELFVRSERLSVSFSMDGRWQKIKLATRDQLAVRF
jgi:hypothetical protein